MAVRHSGPPSNVAIFGVKTTQRNGDTVYYWSIKKSDRDTEFKRFKRFVKDKNSVFLSAEKVERKKTG